MQRKSGKWAIEFLFVKTLRITLENCLNILRKTKASLFQEQYIIISDIHLNSELPNIHSLPVCKLPQAVLNTC
jgi:hypothetical protein